MSEKHKEHYGKVSMKSSYQYFQEAVKNAFKARLVIVPLQDTANTSREVVTKSLAITENILVLEAT